MTTAEKIRELEERLEERRGKVRAGLADRAAARRDRRKAKRELKLKRRERDRLEGELEKALDDDEAARLERHLERNLEERQKLVRILLELGREIDAADDRIRAARARVARMAKRIRHLEAKASGQRGRVISRSEWGAAPARGGYVRQAAITAGVQHHTAMPALPATATVAQEAARMRQIQAIHQGQGWSDIGYEDVTFPSGRTYEGRPAWAVGAHTLNHNTGKAGKAYDANTDNTPLTPAAEAQLRALWDKRIGSRRLYGHRELGPTACPGRDLFAKLDRLN